MSHDPRTSSSTAPSTSNGGAAPAFVLVGHCSPDAGMLRSAVGRAVSGATFITVNSQAKLPEVRQRGMIWLVNRVLDGDFGSDDGMAVVIAAASPAPSGEGPTVMLISNYADAQDKAVAAGAVRGFGKHALYAETTVAAIREAIAAAAS